MVEYVNRPIESLLQARLHDPFGLLGLHREGEEWIVRVYEPYATDVDLLLDDAGAVAALDRIHPAGVFEWRGSDAPPRPYRLRMHYGSVIHEVFDPYQFPPHISRQDLYLFSEGRLHQGYRMLGSHTVENDGIKGIRFAVWAPNAERVSVVGEFNGWDGRIHPMRLHGSSGVWELFIPEIMQNSLYRYEIRNRSTGHLLVKTDPYAQGYELRPGTAALASPARAHCWQDGEWMARRGQWDWLHGAINIYEVHLGSWKRHPDGRFYTYRELATDLRRSGNGHGAGTDAGSTGPAIPPADERTAESAEGTAGDDSPA